MDINPKAHNAHDTTTDHLELRKKEDHGMNSSILYRGGNRMIMGGVERIGPGREGERRGRKRRQDQVLEGTGERYRGSGN